jgi:hypothetical protein
MPTLKRLPGESYEQFSRRQALDQVLREYGLMSLPTDDYDSFLSALSDTVEVMIEDAVEEAQNDTLDDRYKES